MKPLRQLKAIRVKQRLAFAKRSIRINRAKKILRKVNKHRQNTYHRLMNLATSQTPMPRRNYGE